MRKKDLKKLIKWFDQVKEQSIKDSIEFYERKDRPYYEELFEHDKPYSYTDPNGNYYILIDNDNKHLVVQIDINKIYIDISVQVSCFNILNKNAKYIFLKTINKLSNII